jgi:hypothetical protein
MSKRRAPFECAIPPSCPSLIIMHSISFGLWLARLSTQSPVARFSYVQLHAPGFPYHASSRFRWLNAVVAGLLLIRATRLPSLLPSILLPALAPDYFARVLDRLQPTSGRPHFSADESRPTNVSPSYIHLLFQNLSRLLSTP